MSVSERIGQRSHHVRHHLASIVAPVTPSASVPGDSTSAPEERGVGGLHGHAKWPHVADAVIAAALRSSMRLSASHDHACPRTNDTSCLPSPSVTNVRSMLESYDNRARREKRYGKMFRRHAEWPKVADTVIDARIFIDISGSCPMKVLHTQGLMNTHPAL